METKTKEAKAKKSATTEKIKVAEKSGTRLADIINPTAEGRIKKLENFQLLADKHNFLQKKKNEVDRFIVSSDGTKEKITLSNSRGFNLEVSNSQVVEEIIDLISEKLQLFIDASEKEILRYNI